MLEENFEHVPKHRRVRAANLIVRFKRGDEIDWRELDYALQTADIVEKRLDSPLFK
jgi:hypothetical protein